VLQKKLLSSPIYLQLQELLKVLGYEVAFRQLKPLSISKPNFD
jgi:hypothetical protein